MLFFTDLDLYWICLLLDIVKHYWLLFTQIGGCTKIQLCLVVVGQDLQQALYASYSTSLLEY